MRYSNTPMDFISCLKLFRPWQGILEDFTLLAAGLLHEPTTVRDQL